METIMDSTSSPQAVYQPYIPDVDTLLTLLTAFRNGVAEQVNNPLTVPGRVDGILIGVDHAIELIVAHQRTVEEEVAAQ